MDKDESLGRDASEPMLKGNSSSDQSSNQPSLQNHSQRNTFYIFRYPYPKSVIFILGNEVCERFCYYGLRAILVLYLKNVLMYDSNESTAINHIFIFLCYLSPLMGGAISDSYIGKFWTILYLSIVYAIGTAVMAVGSVEKVGLPQRELTWLGMILIAIGTGGIKPCVSAFGGDQFKVPEQAKQLGQFFSLFYLSINLGSGTSVIVTPGLRKLSCLGSDSCYPVSFSVPAVLMIISTVLFVLGKPLYVMRKPEGNIMAQVVKCIVHAIKIKAEDKGDKKEHWLDYASDKYPEKLITSVKALLDVAVIFIPASLFWAAFDQQSSTWIFQAEKMNGKIGDWTILPEQIHLINPILNITLIPIFEFYLYPKIKDGHLLSTPLQKLGLGFLLCAVSFVMAAGLEYIMQKHDQSSIHILWQVPQIVVITIGEILVAIQGLNFGFTQAAMELKSVVMSLWLLMVAVGNLVVVLISGFSLFSNMLIEFLFYAALLFVNFGLFVVLAVRYKTKDFTG